MRPYADAQRLAWAGDGGRRVGLASVDLVGDQDFLAEKIELNVEIMVYK